MTDHSNKIISYWWINKLFNEIIFFKFLLSFLFFNNISKPILASPIFPEIQSNSLGLAPFLCNNFFLNLSQ